LTEEDVRSEPGYQHLHKVQRQIAALPPLGSEPFWLRAQAPEEDPETPLAAETLVYCLRQFLGRGDRASARRVAELLLPRCARTVNKQARNWFSQLAQDQEDMRQEVHCQLWQELCDARERYWEARFYHALKCLGFDVARRLARTGEREQPWPSYVDEEGDLVDVDFEDPDLVDPDERVFLAQALGRLGEPLRTAIYLRYVEEWPIHSQNPAALTISSVLGVTDRTVRNYIKSGRKGLREWFDTETGYAERD
jgi:DNA-directed RNA polymerase specialized sigma24 family protein